MKTFFIFIMTPLMLLLLMELCEAVQEDKTKRQQATCVDLGRCECNEEECKQCIKCGDNCVDPEDKYKEAYCAQCNVDCIGVDPEDTYCNQCLVGCGMTNVYDNTTTVSSASGIGLIRKTRQEKRAHRKKIKILKKIKLMERSKESESQEMSKKSQRNDNCEITQTFNPFDCDFVKKCNFDFMTSMAKLYVKHRNKLKNLNAILRWWKLLQGKRTKADNDASLNPPAAAFSTAFKLLSASTMGGTRCNGAAINSTVLDIYNELKSCTTSAKFACRYDDIRHRFKALKCDNCTSVCCVSSKNCKKVANCTTNCAAEVTGVLLTQEMIDHMTDVCVPQITAWNKRYASCGACITYADCVLSCQDGTEQYNCQAKRCDDCNGNQATTNCRFENCLKDVANGELEYRNCMCDCYKELKDTSSTSRFPIDTTKVGTKNCLELASFFFSVKMRRRRCLNPDGITAEEEQEGNRGTGYRPLGSPDDSRFSGNFVDCRRQERNAMEYIYHCPSKSCSISTSPSPLPPGRRNKFVEMMKNRQSVWKN